MSDSQICPNCNHPMSVHPRKFETVNPHCHAGEWAGGNARKRCKCTRVQPVAEIPLREIFVASGTHSNAEIECERQAAIKRLSEEYNRLRPTNKAAPVNCACSTWAYPDGKVVGCHHPNCDGTGNHRNGVFKESEMSKEAWTINGKKSEDAPEPWKVDTFVPSIRLLVVDMGDACVVKVEKGSMPHTSFDPMKDLSFFGKLSIVKTPFENLRAAMDDKPPQPYFSYEDKKGDHRELVLNSWSFTGPVTDSIYHACSAFHGSNLPVYEPKQGHWTQLTTDAPFDVWRYMRD